MKDRIYAVIVAGGSGKRMGSSIPKQYLELCDKMILKYSIEAFLSNASIDACIVVAAEEYHDTINMTLSKADRYKDIHIVSGGRERIDSVRNGLKEVEKLESSVHNPYGCVYVMIHDGARPLISQELINRCIEGVRTYNAIIPAIDVKDTIKVITETDTIVDTPRRSMLRAAQTPQCFELELLIEAYVNYELNVLSESVPTDDASLIEIYTSKDVHIIEGDEHNLKITTPIDLKIAEMIIADLKNNKFF